MYRTETNVISKEDVKHAAIASSEAYNDNLVVGSTIKGTSFIIVHRVHEVLKANGEGIRVLVADHGNTRIVVYRGTDGYVIEIFFSLQNNSLTIFKI